VYLEASAGEFPCGEDFVRLMRESASFSSLEAIPLSFGIAWLYRGVKG
jgi:ubiquinone/menaquinone biosynthesis C-methylase UbiE